MSKPVFYYHPLSPPARSVVMVARENNIDIELKEIDFLKGEHTSEHFTKINPAQTIPFLVDGDVAICDSQAICLYLIEKYAKDDYLYPKDNFLLRSVINDRLFFNASFLFPRGLNIFFPVIVLGESEVPQYRIDQIHRGYRVLETYLTKTKWVASDEQMTVADLAIFSWMESVAQCYTTEEYPKINAWMTEMRKLPYYEDANKKGADFHIELFKNALKNNKK
ncbi:glutathione S-transferase 1-like [Chironomus tepperi]|uniref:glutathione S-transferase 1-like n=1 Tax=Chironomus tepperi TaxID=113505 RepID=UPI00391F1484